MLSSLRSLAFGLLLLSACRSANDPNPDSPDASTVADLAHVFDLKSAPRDLAPRVDLLPPSGDLAGSIEMPPSSCNQRSAGKTAMQGFLRVDTYKGLYTGSSGTHEDADATLLSTLWVYDESLVDSMNINLAMLVDTTMAGAGLPNEVPLSSGQVFEFEGEYISAASAGATANGKAAAVIHFTHTPCGFSIINGTRYH